MADKKNLCAQIDTALHMRVRQEQERSGQTLSEYVEQLIQNYYDMKENKKMTTITVNVTGMMCGHCEAHVTKAVKEAFGVEDVVSSHEKGTTVIHAPEKLNEDKIREVIKEAGYEVTGITQE